MHRTYVESRGAFPKRYFVRARAHRVTLTQLRYSLATCTKTFPTKLTQASFPTTVRACTDYATPGSRRAHKTQAGWINRNPRKVKKKIQNVLNQALIWIYEMWERKKTYLKFFEVIWIPRPINLSEQVLIEDLAHQLEEVHLHLVECLVLQESVQGALPLLVVQGFQEVSDWRWHLPLDRARGCRWHQPTGSAGWADIVEILEKQRIGIFEFYNFVL